MASRPLPAACLGDEDATQRLPMSRPAPPVAFVSAVSPTPLLAEARACVAEDTGLELEESELADILDGYPLERALLERCGCAANRGLLSDLITHHVVACSWPESARALAAERRAGARAARMN